MESFVQKYMEDVFGNAGELKEETTDVIHAFVEKNRGSRKAILVFLDGEVPDDFKECERIHPKESPQWINAVRPNTHYIIVWSMQYSRKVDDDLARRGFREMDDFLFKEPKPIEISGNFGYYRDKRGNEIHNMRPNVRVTLVGYGNKLLFPRNMACGSMNVVMKYGSRITMKDGVNIQGNSSIIALGRNVVQFGRCSFQPGCKIYMRKFAKLCIGDGSVFGANNQIEIYEFRAMIIGEDVLTSWGVEFVVGDGHAIFDVEAAKNINIYTLRPEQSVVIGNHVWIGNRVCILRDTVIGSGSIVGAYSIVKGFFGNNSMIIGNPVKTRREGRAWSANPIARYEQLPSLYALPTQSLSSELLRFNWTRNLAEYCAEIARASRLICVIAVMDIVGHWIRGGTRIIINDWREEKSCSRRTKGVHLCLRRRKSCLRIFDGQARDRGIYRKCQRA